MTSYTLTQPMGPMEGGPEAAIQEQLEQMGFNRTMVLQALNKLGDKATVDATLEELLSSKPAAGKALVDKPPVAQEDQVEVVMEMSPPKAKKPASPALLRGLSRTSQQVFESVTSSHAGVSQAAVARLLLRTSAALRQGLLNEEQRGLLMGHLEKGQVDLVHEIIAGVGVRSEPSMPLEDSEAVWECPVCFTEQEEQGWSCPSKHRYCSECMRRHVDSTPFPRCPTHKCGYELNEGDLRILSVPKERLDAFRRAKLDGAVDALGTLGTSASSSSGPRDTGATGSRDPAPDLQEVVIRCPNPDCNNAVLVSKRDRRAYSCSCGTAPFCTRCRQSPYHYHADCSDVGPLRRRWLDWITQGRAQHLGDAAKSASWEDQAKALREGVDRSRELEADEEWKAAHCRCCPHCNRTVQKLSGCDSMVCGSDAHGGNDQKGCGQSFAWSAAPKYKAKVESREMPKITAEEVRCRGRDTLHAFVDCSLCGSGGKGIRGPRFRCIHCRSFDVCSECEPHLAELHPRDHVFQILFESDFEWGSMRLPRGTRVRAVRRGEEIPKHLGGDPLPDPASKGLEGLCGAIAKKPKKRKREEPAGQYQWQGDRGRWHDYGDDINAQIVAAVLDGQTRVRVGIAGTRYELDLDRMQQRNLATRGRRPLRASPAAAAAAAAAAKRAEDIEAQSYPVLLDLGGTALVATKHLEPLLTSRKEAEELMKKAMEIEEKGEPDSPVPERDEEEEEEEDGSGSGDSD